MGLDRLSLLLLKQSPNELLLSLYETSLYGALWGALFAGLSPRRGDLGLFSPKGLSGSVLAGEACKNYKIGGLFLGA